MIAGNSVVRRRLLLTCAGTCVSTPMIRVRDHANRGGDAANESAAADADIDARRARQVFENLQADGPCPAATNRSSNGCTSTPACCVALLTNAALMSGTRIRP